MTNDTARAGFERFAYKYHLPIDRDGHVYAGPTTEISWRSWQASRAESDAIVDRLVEALIEEKNFHGPSITSTAALQAAEEYRKGRILTAADNTEAKPPAINEGR